jgi:cell division protein FtsI (penicillin-binding protein 3)
MDSPDHSMHFGAQASAPVFQGLAQEILEYLGVPHDIEVKSTQEMAKAKAANGPEEHDPQTDENLEELFAEVNNLPPDDPLRAPKEPDNQRGSEASQPGSTTSASAAPLNVAPVVSSPPSPSGAAPALSQVPPPPDHKLPVTEGNGAVVVDSTRRVAVPSFLGQPLRRVIELAGSAGLTVEAVGDGLAREQAPTPGTMVPAGTEVVVRFVR